MLKLIQKDLILCSRLIATLYILYGCLCAYFFLRSTDLIALLLAAVMFSFIPIAVVSREELFKAGAWTCTLPVTRRQIVASRYLLTGLMGLVGLSFLAVLSVLMNLFLKNSEVLFSLRNFLVATGVTVMIFSLVLPILLRYGLVSLFILGAGLQGFLIIGVLLAEVAGARSFLRPRLAQLVALLIDLYQYAGEVGFLLLVAAVLAAIAFLSFHLAHRIYLTREF